MRLKPNESPIPSSRVKVISRKSNSRLAEVYGDPEFRDDWDNDVRFHVARNIVHLRKHRKESQKMVASEMGTSQSALARIESGHENITLDTLQRLIAALNGRFYISIQPAEFPTTRRSDWWEQKTSWKVVGCIAEQTTDCDRMIVGLERKNSASTLALASAQIAASGT